MNSFDCRVLKFSLEVYQFTLKMAIDLSTELVLWTESLVKEGFVKKRLSKNRNTSLEKALCNIKEELQSEIGCSYLLEAFAISPSVYNQKTMTSYTHKMLWEQPDDGIEPRVSVDYPQYWKELFPNGREEEDVIKQNIVRIFREKDKICKSLFYIPDAQAHLSMSTYRNDIKLLYGSFHIDFSAFCLNNQLEDMANVFSEFAKQIAEKYVNVNARVQLQPIGKSYRRYFNGIYLLDNSHVAANCREHEWYPTYYLEGVEWMNVVSPLTRQHLQNYGRDICASERVLVEELQGGGLLVASRKDIMKYDISDALELKRLLYPALYPGLESYTLRDIFRERERHKGGPIFWIDYPRSDWAIVPVFEEEVKIVATYLVISTIKKTEE